MRLTLSRRVEDRNLTHGKTLHRTSRTHPEPAQCRALSNITEQGAVTLTL
jgi:hypothetical protein